MKDRKIILPIHMVMLHAAAVLLVLVLLSTNIVSGRYARYISSGTAEDHARVATFLVEETGQMSETFCAMVSPDSASNNVILIVNNRSEVAVEYEITIENVYQNLPITLNIEGSEGTYTGQMAPAENKNFTLNVLWEEDNTDPSYAGMVDLIRVTLKTTQID